MSNKKEKRQREEEARQAIELAYSIIFGYVKKLNSYVDREFLEEIVEDALVKYVEKKMTLKAFTQYLYQVRRRIYNAERLKRFVPLDSAPPSVLIIERVEGSNGTKRDKSAKSVRKRYKP
jgi:G3E family GTPase